VKEAIWPLHLRAPSGSAKGAAEILQTFFPPALRNRRRVENGLQ